MSCFLTTLANSTFRKEHLIKEVEKGSLVAALDYRIAEFDALSGAKVRDLNFIGLPDTSVHHSAVVSLPNNILLVTKQRNYWSNELVAYSFVVDHDRM